MSASYSFLKPNPNKIYFNSPREGKYMAPSLIPLSPERAPFCKPSTPTCGLAQHRLAVSTHNNGLRVAEHSCYVEATLALDIHEEGIGRLHETLELVLPLLNLRRRVQ